MKKTIKSLLLVTVVFAMMLNAFGLVSMAAHPAKAIVSLETVDAATNIYKLVLTAQSESDLSISDLGPVTMIFSYDNSKVVAVAHKKTSMQITAASPTSHHAQVLKNCGEAFDLFDTALPFTNAGVKMVANETRTIIKWDQDAPSVDEFDHFSNPKSVVLGEFYFQALEPDLTKFDENTIKFETNYEDPDSMLPLVILTQEALETDSASIGIHASGQYYPETNSELNTLTVELPYLDSFGSSEDEGEDDVPMSNDVYVNDAEATLEENDVEFEATQNLIGAGVKATFDLSKYTDYTLKNMIWALATDAGRKYTEAIAFDGIAVGNAVELAATFSNGTKDGAIEKRTITGVDAIFKLINAENAELVVFTNSDADAANEAE